jgi:predicted RNA methylase
MTTAEALITELNDFIDGTTAGLLQVLVAAARPSIFRRIINCPTYPTAAGTPGLSKIVRKFRQGMQQTEIHPPTLLARLYVSTNSIAERKQAGQFFTAKEVADWALSLSRPSPEDDVCDAGAGTGVFAYSLLQSGINVRSYLGVENDPILALCAAHVLESAHAPRTYKVWYANFMLLDAKAFEKNKLDRPTFVVSNPPFVRSHHLTGRARIRASLKASFGIMLSSFSGSMDYFLVRAAQLVRPDSIMDKPRRRLLFLLPKEAAGAAHSQKLRDDLSSKYSWRSRQHDILISTTGIDNHRSNALALVFVFEQRTHCEESNAAFKTEGPVLRDIVQIRRGISTGCNDFFVLSESDIEHRLIDRHWLTKVLPTRIHLPEFEFTTNDWEALRKSGHKCWLLTLPKLDLEEFEPPLQDYLREGLRRGLHATTTAKSLRVWFSLPVPATAPDLFITYFFRGAPRFILNGARVQNLTNILGGRFVDRRNCDTRSDIVKSLNVEAAAWEKGVGREYKGGLRKIEPRELSSLPLSVLSARFVQFGQSSSLNSTSLPFE